MYSKNNQNE